MGRLAAMDLLCFVLVVGLAVGVESGYIKYNTGGGPVEGKLNVHLVPHSHDDVGWLKTVDQYYVGSNNSIQGASVENVLDSVIVALLRDSNRKFVFAEQAFFQRWWRAQSEEIQEMTKKLVTSGQLEFINGGWCMHDEATCHYIDMIDQTTLGHLIIKKQFNVTPRTGWQIDPFGHSAVQAYLFGAELGFESLHFARIDYQDRAKRKADKSLEVIWRGSKTFGSSSQIFTNAFPVHYSPPKGFHFEVNDDSVPVQDDPLLFDYNVDQRVNDFVNAAINQANVTRTNHMMWTMGDDFQYQYAETWYKQLDKLIHYVNKDGRVNAFYSTPSLYTDSKHSANESWPLKTDDYFPYADSTNAYWTGYFTSRPSFKGYIRKLSGYYVAARQLEYLAGRKSLGPNTFSLGDALGLAQHHDALTGTAKQHTTNDYTKRLSIGATEAELTANIALSCLTNSNSTDKCKSTAVTFTQCRLLNISYCSITEEPVAEGKSLVVVAYNSLGWAQKDIIRIPVNDKDLMVRDSSGHTLEVQYVNMDNATSNLRSFYLEAYLGISSKAPKYWLLFEASVPPLGWTTYFISKANGKDLNGKADEVDTVSSSNNSLGWAQKDIIRIPVNDKDLMVRDSSGHTLEVQYVNMDNATSNLRSFYLEAYLGISLKAPKYWLLFEASVPPLGWTTYFISKANGKDLNGKADEVDTVSSSNNSLGWAQKDIIRIPVNDKDLMVRDSSGHTLEVQYVNMDNATSNLGSFYLEAYLRISSKAPKYWLLFEALVPPLGWTTYFISKANGKDLNGKADEVDTVSSSNDTVEVGPGNLRISFSLISGQIERMTNIKTGVDVPVQQSYLYYISSIGDEDAQASGAYIFRPTDSPPIIASRSVPLNIVRGNLVHEVHQQFNSWISQVTRLYRDKEHAEIEFTIGPIPTDDGLGKEVITRMTANMATNKIYYTDSNGRDFLKRVRDYRSDWTLDVHQPVSGNYYPINLGIFLSDEKSEFSVLVDRAVGGGSIQDGQLEIMLHRRMLVDDSRGVGEPLDETVCVGKKCEGLTIRGKYYISIDKLGSGTRWRRTVGQQIYSPLLLAFSQEEENLWRASRVTTKSNMDSNYTLPPNIAIITLEELDDTTVLLRLAHLYEAGEDAEYSNMAEVDLKRVFANKTIKEVKETSLSANQQKSEIKRLEWKVEGDNGVSTPVVRGGPLNGTTLVVQLGPMEIRTFLVKFN